LVCFEIHPARFLQLVSNRLQVDCQLGLDDYLADTGNLRLYRELTRKEIPRFIEAYLRCPLEVAIEREKKRQRYAYAPRGIYHKALEEESSTVPGIGAPYEEPLNPEVIVDTDKFKPQQCAQKIFDIVVQNFVPTLEK
jgi:adenylylsulfate kinase